mmetsp:Transcript_12988/g.39313  ORF Transcript_12988/g.39313 Transcript_12988/m.39313 type:complete len:166 (-) Transcript_12988:229-726(-)
MQATSPKAVQPPECFPYCLIWTPLPLITWILPFVGHMGICDSSGTIHDFASPFHINRGRLTFGDPTRYIQMTEVGRDSWDRAVEAARCEYSQGHTYDFCSDNCHCFVAQALNRMQYGGRRNWNMVSLATLLFFRGKHVGLGGVLRTWLPFTLLCTIAVVLAATLS